MARLNPEIENAGAQIIVITMGKPDETQAFCSERAPGVNCYSDPSMDSYKRYGLTRGNANQLFGPAVWLKGAQVTTEGAFEGLSLAKPVGDPFQMPGVFVVDTEGRVVFAYYSSHAGDYPESDALLKLAQN